MTTHLQRMTLGPSVASAAVNAISANGKLVDTNTAGKPAAVRVGTLDILLTTPFTKAVGTPARYGVDIWSDSEGHKVFSAWWNGSPDDDSFEIVRFDRGAWVDALCAR
ncbi:MAG TPA: hypothetical protein VKU41_08330 [Polyangiaceae bacterium]|nr:hypothetical protein [Polyangiaceae bacterium]